MNSCDFCHSTYKSTTRYVLHSIWELTAVILLVAKYFIWSVYTLRFKLKDHTKYPCRSCKHACWLHLLNAIEPPGNDFNAIKLLFDFKFVVLYPLEQQLCLQCMLLFFDPRKKGIEQEPRVDHAYWAMDNLSYLEMKAHKE